MPATPPVDIALVLPLDAPAYARAADAVRAGFLAAGGVTGPGVRTRVFAHDAEGVVGAFEEAVQAGAKVIVGPLLRDDLKLVAAVFLDLPYTIALNQFDEAAGPPPTLYTFPLSIESDARQIAKRIAETSMQPGPGGAPATPPPSVVVVSSETALMRRFGAAFTQEWLATGGTVPSLFRFDGTADALTAMRRELAKTPPAAALLALDGASATLAKPYLGVIPAYASALVFERETLATVRDLDGLIVTEIPWIITPDAPQLAALPRREFGSAALTRLYALGLDAFRVALAFRAGAPRQFTLQGATGQITLVGGNAFAREGRFGVYSEGQLVPLETPR